MPNPTNYSMDYNYYVINNGVFFTILSKNNLREEILGNLFAPKCDVNDNDPDFDEFCIQLPTS